MRELVIAGRRLADDAPPLVCAEIGNSHQGQLGIALAMIRKAAQCGAGAVKFQKRSNSTLYSRALLDAPYANENSFGATYGEHREALELSPEALRDCFHEARRCRVIGFATAFDETSADQLMALDVPAIKLASGALTDTALQQHVASFHIPIILSTGGGTAEDIDRAVQTITAIHPQLALLHAVASYPMLDAKDANLRCILTLRSRYPELVIGYSSHSPGIMLSLVAVAFGASIVEQHFTLSRAMKGTDHAFSLEPRGLETLCEDVGKVHAALGDGVKRWLECERGPISKMRRVMTENGLQVTGRLDADH
jgi:N-acetylneuraminate synthase/sialic acid synthase